MKLSVLKTTLLLLGLTLITAQECYIGNCGCPGEFKEDWCNESQSKFESKWCNESESQCGQCQGTWCEQQPKTNGVCYIDVCGCPNNWLQSWCGLEEAKFESEWCQQNNFRCDECGGYWCSGDQLIEGEKPPAEEENDQDKNDQDQDQDQEGEGEENQDQDQEPEGLCYIDVCACPAEFLNEWCDVESAKFAADWCQANQDQCERCKGYWCVGDDLVEDDKEEDEYCYISECGCPGNFQQDWCKKDANLLPGGYCQDNEGNCQDCSGVWCPGGDQGEGDLDEDGGDDQTVNASVNVFFAGFAVIIKHEKALNQIKIEQNTGSDKQEQIFSFQNIFDQKTEQQLIYDEMVKPLIENALQGINCAIYTYGQTGSAFWGYIQQF
ncbi:P-loop containing nucleoside triphosphate hydrolase [Pseudocohnilembus persalinus]|uniref:p-loop containing nucleoside triphosphate hydrolase n=1 Tax=Pseudocohnilembus persalinus TaxID=266149 RepID=A0A0V0QFC0_PSEPJ|nr:P-loop containing nucleoside triphosphate hydrolase [Pseudocohnilembus persalinus]|eukprot:KRX00884.1 P-loop containing nucleoside triphosphate hydrolase [Pseudocohnilembus persalinus]